MRVSTRLWLAATLSLRRDTALADPLMQQVRPGAQSVCARLVCTQGGSASPKSIGRALRQKVKETARRGRGCWRVWPPVHIGTVIKPPKKLHVVQVRRQMAHATREPALHLLDLSRAGTMLQTAFIERFNAPMRERLATLTRKCRHAAARLSALHTGLYLVGTPSHFSWPHQQLSQVRDRATGTRHRVQPCTPARAAGLSDHVWSAYELLSDKLAPPPWIVPKRRRRPRTRPLPDPTRPQRPRGRPRKQVACPTTS
jgi:hypothetical protein